LDFKKITIIEIFYLLFFGFIDPILYFRKPFLGATLYCLFGMEIVYRQPIII